GHLGARIDSGPSEAAWGGMGGPSAVPRIIGSSQASELPGGGDAQHERCGGETPTGKGWIPPAAAPAREPSVGGGGRVCSKPSSRWWDGGKVSNGPTMFVSTSPPPTSP